jgi:tetratricopeptide (TPR) repeat protein
MKFDTANPVIKLLAEGMNFEGEGKKEEAIKCFHKAWNTSLTDFEKCISAHYIARHQNTVIEKLEWDEKALNIALTINEEEIKGLLPSLYLNIAKCHEDLNNYLNANKNYKLALSYLQYLSNDGYGKMICAGIRNGLQRTEKS